jgi:hypothetical protein
VGSTDPAPGGNKSVGLPMGDVGSVVGTPGREEVHGGLVLFESVGDAVYGAFAHPTDAVAAALADRFGYILRTPRFRRRAGRAIP